MVRDPKKTSYVPTDDLRAVTNTLTEVAVGVAYIKDTQLPPLAQDTREARDTAREALQKVDTHLLDVDAHIHPCDEKDRQARQDTDIADMRPKVSGNARLVWWLIAIFVLVGGSAITFAIMTRTSEASISTSLESHGQTLRRHEKELDALEKAQHVDRKLFIQEVRQIPNRVKDLNGGE
jgi:hypothetical protein